MEDSSPPKKKARYYVPDLGQTDAPPLFFFDYGPKHQENVEKIETKQSASVPHESTEVRSDLNTLTRPIAFSDSETESESEEAVSARITQSIADRTIKAPLVPYIFSTLPNNVQHVKNTEGSSTKRKEKEIQVQKEQNSPSDSSHGASIPVPSSNKSVETSLSEGPATTSIQPDKSIKITKSGDSLMETDYEEMVECSGTINFNSEHANVKETDTKKPEATELNSSTTSNQSTESNNTEPSKLTGKRKRRRRNKKNKIEQKCEAELLLNLQNPKGKLLEYFQKSKQPLPEFEYCVRIRVGGNLIPTGLAWRNNAKEAERLASIDAIKNIDELVKELHLPSPKSVGYTIEENSGSAQGPAEKSQPAASSSTTRPSPVPVKKEPVIESEHVEPPTTEFNEVFLNAIVEKYGKKAPKVYTNNPKGDLKNWAALMKVQSEEHRESGELIIKVNGNAFVRTRLGPKTGKNSIRNLYSSGVQKFLKLREFLLSNKAFPLLKLGEPFFLRSFHAFDSYFTVSGPQNSDIHSSIDLVLPNIDRALNCFVKSKHGGTIHLGVEDVTRNFVVDGVRTNVLQDLRDRIYKIVQLWFPPLKPGSFVWNVVPVYDESEIRQGKHYQDFVALHDKALWLQERNMEWDVSSVVQYSLSARHCIVMIEVPSGRSQELYCCPRGAFTHDHEQGREPVPWDLLSHPQKDYMSKHIHQRPPQPWQVPPPSHLSHPHPRIPQYPEPPQYYPREPAPFRPNPVLPPERRAPGPTSAPMLPATFQWRKSRDESRDPRLSTSHQTHN